MSKSDNEVIFVCEECDKIFTPDEKKVSDESGDWGHPCKKPWRCESYLKKFKESK